jgi:hypothetical protein
LNAVLMPYVLKANRPAIEARIVDAARYLELPLPSFDAFLAWVLELRERIGIPPALAELGIDASQADRIGELAVADASNATNPRPLSPADYARLFADAVKGRL